MPSLKSILIVAVGFIVALLSLWTGFYFLLTTPTSHWSELPTLITMVVGIFIGVGIIDKGSEVDA